MNKRHLSMLIAVAALLTPLTATGCGGGDEAAEAALTKAQFGKKADLICASAADEQFKTAAAYLNKHPGTKEVDLVEPAGVPPLEKELRNLAALPAPKGQEDDVLTLLKELRHALQEIKRNPNTALSTTDNPYDNANTLARHLRMGDCSGNP